MLVKIILLSANSLNYIFPSVRFGPAQTVLISFAAFFVPEIIVYTYRVRVRCIHVHVG